MKKVTSQELRIYMDQARKELLNIGGGHFLPGMNNAMTDGEALAFAFLRASLMIWNPRGMLTSDWDSKVDLEPLEESSSPDTE